MIDALQAWALAVSKPLALFAMIMILGVFLGIPCIAWIAEAKLKQDKKAQEILKNGAKLQAKPQGEGKVYSI